MGEDKEIPVREKLPTEVLASEYKRAHGILEDFINDPNNEHIDNYKSLAARTSAVGLELSILLRGGGTVITETKESIFAEDESQKSWKNYRWGINGKNNKAIFRATYEPEHNLVHVIYAEKGTLDSITNGYELFIPTNTEEHNIYINEDLPNIIIWGERADWLTYNPASEDNKNSPFHQTLYSVCLFESVSAILEVLPEPATD